MSDAILLDQYPFDHVRLVCEKCGRQGSYPRVRLFERFGAKATMPDVLRELADCDRWRMAGDPCGAHYPDLGNSDVT